jgi:hypothetical protein
MKTTCEIKPYTALGGGGSDIFITHEGRRYYSRVNYFLQNTTGMQNLCINQFLQRRARS